MGQESGAGLESPACSDTPGEGAAAADLKETSDCCLIATGDDSADGYSK